MGSALLKFHQVTLVRGLQVVVQDLDMRLEPGQILAIRGENGAGKTSVLRAGAHLLTPFSGQVTWSPHAHVRYLGHDLALKRDQRPQDILDPAALADWALRDLAHVPLAYLSAGQQKRVVLAHRCRPGANLWLMDEPFANLDTGQQHRLREVLQRHSAAGGAALCSVHGDELPGPTLRLAGGRAHVTEGQTHRMGGQAHGL